jgi:hypothetical protein
VIVANEGSNTLSVLFGDGQGANWTLLGGPQLVTGPGPVATAVLTGPDGTTVTDLVVSDSQGASLRVLPGVGLGYFADNHAITISTGTNGLDPGPLFVGTFGGSGQDLVTLNLQSSTLSYFADFPQQLSTPTGPTATLSSGGHGPVAAVVGNFGGNGYSAIIVANQDGTIALFEGGPGGLTFVRSIQIALSDITALALGAEGTLLVGGPGGVVALPLGPLAFGTNSVIAGGLPGGQGNNGPARPAPSSVASGFGAMLVPSAGTQTSGTAGEAVGTASAGGGGADPLGGLASQAPIDFSAVALDTTAFALAKGAAVAAEVSPALILGAGMHEALANAGGGPGGVATLTAGEDEAPGGDPADAEPDPFGRMIDLNYRDVLPDRNPGPTSVAAPGGEASPPAPHAADEPGAVALFAVAVATCAGIAPQSTNGSAISSLSSSRRCFS